MAFQRLLKTVLIPALILALSMFDPGLAGAGKRRADQFQADTLYLCKEQGSDPSNPATGTAGLYCKTDGRWYLIDDAGSVIKVGDASLIEDADGDTKIQTEESADEDIIRFDVLGSQAGRIDTTGWVLKGNDVSGDGPLHIGAGLAGSVTANAEADDMVVEGTTRAGYSMLVQDGGIAKILAGSPSNGSNYGGLQFHGGGASLRFRVAGDEKINLNDAEFRVNYGGGTPEATFNFRFDGSSLNYLLFLDSGVNNAGMGTNSPDASALLDMVSTTKGLGLPSMTTTERDAITTPRDGLMVYDETSDAVSVRANGSWVNLLTTATSGQGSAKGWVNFDGTGTLAVRDSFNVTSVTDNGTGDYTINWDTDFATANYAVAYGPLQGQRRTADGSSANQLAGSIRFTTRDPSGGVEDNTNVRLIAFGDQ